MFRVALGCLLVVSLTLAAAVEDVNLDVDDGVVDDDDGRLFMVPVELGLGGNPPNILGNNLGNINWGNLLPIIQALLPWLVALSALAAATAISIAVPLGVLGHYSKFCGYDYSGSGSGGGYGSSSGHSSYSSYRR